MEHVNSVTVCTCDAYWDVAISVSSVVVDGYLGKKVKTDDNKVTL